jgi:glycosyltransferase involved in cell wall biosynthesis
MSRFPPTAAVVIPAYNAALTLDRAISSVVAALQKCIHFSGLAVDAEVLVVDDASTDATPEIAKAWNSKESRVKLIRNAANRGPGFSRNEGVRRTAAQFLFFLDADDVFFENHIHACLAALLADDTLGYVFTRTRIDLPMHPDWPRSIDESNPINFCVRRVWHDWIKGFPEEDDFRVHRTEDTLYRLCLRELVKHRKIDVATCEQFVSPGNALDRQRRKFAMSMAEWNRSGLDDGFRVTAQMEAVVKARLDHVARLLGARR